MQVLWMDAALVQFRRLRERLAREEAGGGEAAGLARRESDADTGRKA